MQEFLQQLFTGIKQTSALEYIAVVFGIASVIFSRMENILVYPVGLVNTSIFIYLYLVNGLYADATVNFYYTVMSIIGWVMWSKKNNGQTVLSISISNKKEWSQSLFFFSVCFAILFFVLKFFTDSIVPVADSFTAAAAFTAMWLMNKKKLENWIWWMITNIVSIPLNFYKGLVFTSFQYLVFLVLAIMGYLTWKKKLQLERN